MRKRQPVDYQSVVETCTSMVAAQERPTVRKLQERLGGSFSTLSTFLNQWLEQKTMAEAGSQDISTELRQALLAETAKAVAKTKDSLNAKLQSQATRLAEMQELLAEAEAKLEELAQQQATTIAQHQEQIIGLEKSLAAAEAKAAMHAEQALDWQQKFTVLQEQYHQADRRAAVAEALAAENAKRLASLERPNKTQ